MREQVGVVAFGKRRQQDKVLRVLRQTVTVLLARSVGGLHHSTAMRHTCGDTHKDRYSQLLRQVKRLTCHVVRLLLVGGLEARDKCELGIEPRVLLVLRTVHRRIVSRHNNQSAVDARDGRVDKRIGADVHTHVLHTNEGAFAGVGHAEGSLHGGLLVGCPLAKDAGRCLALVELDVLCDFGRWCTRIGIHTAQACVDSRLSNSLVT